MSEDVKITNESVTLHSCCDESGETANECEPDAVIRLHDCYVEPFVEIADPILFG
jgi:hypothetical protein